MTSSRPNISQDKEPSSFRLISALGIAGFLSGLVLVSVYIYTAPIIDQNRAEALKAAIFEVLPQTTSFRAFVLEDGELKEVESESESGAEKVYMGLTEDGTISGFAIPGAEPGYQDIISGLAGYDADDQVIIGFKVLDSKETPGLGDKIYKDTDFQLNFTNLSVIPAIEVVKKGEKSEANQVEAITGATISSEAVVRLLNKSMEKWKAPIQRYMNEKVEGHGE
jgi:electron transport complex protein RnfG